MWPPCWRSVPVMVVELARSWRARAADWDAANRSVVTNAGSWLATAAVTSSLGFAYWWLAAQLFPPASVGLGAASVAAMTLLGTVGMLGLGTLLIGEVARQPGRERSLVITAALPAGLASGALGVGFAVSARLVSPELAPLAADAPTVAVFALGVSLAAVALVVDQGFLGLLRGEIQLARNTVFAVAKLALLLPAGLWWANGPAMTIYATWVAGNLLSLVGLAGVVVAKSASGGSYRPQWDLLHGLGGAALAHHGLNLAIQAPLLALPLVVTVLLSATMNAYFYVAWMLATFVYMGPIALTTALYAAGARAPAALAPRLRFSLGLAAAGGGLATVVLLVGAGYVLHLFGAAYAAQAETCLRILALGVFPIILREHYVAISRVRQQIGQAAGFIAMGGLLSIILAVIGAILGGLAGLAAGYVLGECILAACVAPIVYRAAALPGSG